MLRRLLCICVICVLKEHQKYISEFLHFIDEYEQEIYEEGREIFFVTVEPLQYTAIDLFGFLIYSPDSTNL